MQGRSKRIPQISSVTGASSSDGLMSYLDTHWGSFTPKQKCSWCILQDQPNGPQDTLEEYYPSVAMKSVYSSVPIGWATGDSLEDSYPSVEMQSVY